MRKNFVKNLVGGVAAFTLLALTLAGCGAKKDISGTYSTDLKLNEFMSESEKDDLKELESMGMGFFGDMTMRFNMELTEDKKFTLSADGSNLAEQMKSGVSAHSDEIIKALLDAQGISEDMYDQVATASGYDSFDAMKTEMIDTMASEMDGYVDTFDKEFAELTTSGSYTVKGDDVIFTTVDDGIGFDAAKLTENGALKLTVDFDGETKELVFNKQ